MSSYLGQNFLVDSKAKTYIRDLVLKMKEKYNLTHCLEIGPGKGAITKLIQPIFNNNFRAIEKDETFKDVLNDIVENGEKIEENGEKIEENGEKIEESGEKIESRIIWNDVLQVDLETIKLNYNQTLVYGSLPYYITSPIISKFFLPTQAPSPSEGSGAKGAVGRGSGGGQESQVGIFITQKEFAQKIETNAKKKSYLRRLLNHNHIVTYHKTIPAKSFSPAPKVDSAIISIVRDVQQDVDYDKMLIILDKISGFKRKTIGKIIKIISDPRRDGSLNRPQTLNRSQTNAMPARREKAVPFPITDSPITPFPITDSPITEPPNMIDDIPLRPQNIIKIEKKRLEELSREEMKVLVDYLYDSDYNEIDHR